MEAGAPATRREFVVAGTSHRIAPLEVRERLVARDSARAFSEAAVQAAGLEGGILLSTCNRVEYWGVATQPPPRSAASDIAGRLGVEVRHVQVLHGPAAFLHAIRVASGLDSGVWGEPQIAIQVRSAAKRLSNGRLLAPPSQAVAETVGRVLGAARDVRRSARLPRGSRGAPEATADAVRRARARTVLVLGAGPVGRRAAELMAPWAEVTLAARNGTRARALADRVGARGVSLGEGLTHLSRYDAAVIAVRTTDPILRVDKSVSDAGSLRLLIDLSFPRAVAREGRPPGGPRVIDIDELAAQDATTLPTAYLAAAEAAALARARALFYEGRGGGPDRTIGRLRRQAESVRDKECARAVRLLSGDPARDAVVVRKLGERLVGQLLHGPTEALRASWADDDFLALERAARRLFRLEGTP